MINLRQAAQQALEALERAREIAMVQTLKARIPECGEFSAIAQDVDWSIVTMKAALEQPEQEPVISAWSLREVYFDEDGEPSMHRSPPAAQRKPLTDEEIENLYKRSAGYGGDDFHSFARAIEAALKERNNG